MIDTYLSAHVAALADYAVKTGLIESSDRVWAVNGLLQVLDLQEFAEPEQPLDLPLEDIEVKTPIATGTFKTLAGKKLAIVPILRAGLGMVDGIINMIPSAKVGHIGLYRDPETHRPVEYYCKMPADIAERDVIVLDPMLATGGSASAAITFIKGYGCKHIKLMNVLAAPEGIECIMKDHPDVEIYVAGVDEKLNEHAYIVPGLGDAGDRIFGTK